MVLQPVYGAIPLTFQTHFSTRKATWAFMAGSFVFAGAFVVSFALQAGLVGFDSYVYLPESGEELVVEADDYEALRAPGSRARVPTIGSDVVRAPYLQLFVPYRPSSDRRLLEAACPDLEPLRAEGVFVRPLLGEILHCFARVWRVTRDGEPLGPELEFYRHPRRGTAGLIAHLGVGGRPGIVLASRLPR